MNSFYVNRLIKIVSPINEEVFTIQLGGSEEELKELIGTILNINPQSIKGIRDSFGNYHTISSAIMNKNLTMGYSSYYFIVINNNENSLNSSSHNTMILEKNNLNFYQNYNFGDRIPNIRYKENSNNEQNEKIALTLFKENLIDKNKYEILKKMINEENEEILTLFKLYINHGKDIKKLSKQIIPILNDNKLNIKNNSNKIDEAIKNVNINNMNVNHSDKYINILNSIQNTFGYQDIEIDLLKKLLLCDNGYTIKAFEDYSLNNNQNLLKSSLDKILKNYSERFIEKKDSQINDNKIKKTEENLNSKKKNSILKEKKLVKKGEKIQKKILKTFSTNEGDFLQDCILLFKADMAKLNTKEKLNLFENEFKIKDSKSPINSTSQNLIKQYYNNQLKNKYFKNFNSNEIKIYEDLIKNNNENIINAYKKYIENKNSDELSSEIRKWILKIIEEKEKEELENFSSSSSEIFEEEEEEEESENSEGENYESSDSQNFEENKNEDKNEEEDDSSLHSSTSEAMNSSRENEKKKNISDNNFLLLNKKNDNNNRESFIINKTSRKNYDASQMLTNNYRLHTLRKLNNEEKKDNNNEEKKDNKNEEKKLTLVSLKKAEEIANENNRKENNNNNNIMNNFLGSDRKMNEFIKVINSMSFNENSKRKILELINNKNNDIMNIYQKYQKNKLYLTKKVLLNLLEKTNEDSNLNSKTNKSPNSNNSKTLNTNKSNKSLSFENYVKKLENENKINKQKTLLLINEFNSGNNMLLSFWEIYKKGKDKEELFENIEIFLKKFENKIPKNIKNEKDNKELNGGKTPLSIQSFKKDLVNYLKNTERKETKTKQKKIIDLLIKEHFLNHSSQKFFYDKISNEDKEVTAAFEVFSVTLNHIDFSETLNLIYDLVTEKSKEDKKKNNDKNHNKNKDEFLIRLNRVLDKGKFNDNEKKIAKEEYEKKNNVLMSILEVYDPDDEEDTIDSLKSLIPKIIHSKGL